MIRFTYFSWTYIHASGELSLRGVPKEKTKEKNKNFFSYLKKHRILFHVHPTKYTHTYIHSYNIYVHIDIYINIDL